MWNLVQSERGDIIAGIVEDYFAPSEIYTSSMFENVAGKHCS